MKLGGVTQCYLPTRDTKAALLSSLGMAELLTLLAQSISPYHCRAPIPASGVSSLPFKFTISTTINRAPTSSTMPLLVWQTTLLPQCSTNGNSTLTFSESFPDTRRMLFSLFQEVGFNERDAEALFNSNSSLKLTPFDSIRSRVRSQQALGVSHLALSRLILKRPEVLTAPEIDSLVRFLLRNDDLDIRGKIELAKIVRLLSATEPSFFLGFEAK